MAKMLAQLSLTNQVHEGYRGKDFSLRLLHVMNGSQSPFSETGPQKMGTSTKEEKRKLIKKDPESKLKVTEQLPKGPKAQRKWPVEQA